MRSARSEERVSEKLLFTACISTRMWLGKPSIRSGSLKLLTRSGSQIIKSRVAVSRFEKPAVRDTFFRFSENGPSDGFFSLQLSE